MKRLMILVVAALMTMMFTMAPASAQSDAEITLIHGIPDTDVDVVVDGAPVIEAFAFGDTADLTPFAGTTLVGLTVNLAGTDTVAIDIGDFDVPATGSYTVIAHLSADGTPTVAVFENDTSTVAAGEGRLVVRHTAAAPGVDVLANGDVAFSNLENPNEVAADLPAGTISAEVVPTGVTEPVVIGPADLPIGEGASLIVYAVGSLDDGNLSVLTQSIEGLGSAPSAVNTGNSPVSGGASSTGLILVIVAGAAALIIAVPAARRRVTTR